jgi:hypothetical protein
MERIASNQPYLNRCLLYLSSLTDYILFVIYLWTTNVISLTLSFSLYISTYRIWWWMCFKLLQFSHLQVLPTAILGENYHFIHWVCESVCFEFSDSIISKKSDSTVCVPGQCMWDVMDKWHCDRFLSEKSPPPCHYYSTSAAYSSVSVTSTSLY